MFLGKRHQDNALWIYPVSYRFRGGRPGAACLWLMMVLSLGGAVAIGVGLASQQSVSATRSAGSISTKWSQPTLTTQDRPSHSYLPFAEPTKLELPSIGVKTDIISVGKTPEGGMEVPQAPHFDKAAWYRHSPAPGQYGASVIIGHVDSYASQSGSVFYNLSKLKLLDRVSVSRTDGTTVNFEVRAIRDYGKEGLPHDIIYGPVSEAAELRLITCSGTFDTATGQYERNTVVFASVPPQ